ncbi:glycosyltransferase family 4 protein [Anabaena sp. CS-542/02]|uniref:glycosyltransferase family 4 protein n=1 Tax=Anabaena sp. CS-542/02 TaxID=3021719 RepID=UPI0023307755|nr:glycosyltransferase [Anabaena sp. CS-542/02]MDB9446464.1 glycosyltransferase [Anabaena sp. CS-542/02]
MKLCWLIPDDRSGGVASVAISCCEQAAKAGYETTLLLVLEPTSRLTANNLPFRVASFGLEGLAEETPVELINWLSDHPQDVLLLNGCEQTDAVIPYLPSTIKCIYVVHDTAYRYWKASVKQESDLDAVVAVSETVAREFRQYIKNSQKLSVILNGCNFSDLQQPISRKDDIIFLGGDNPRKGAFDALKIWSELSNHGFIGNLHWFGNISPTFQIKIKQLPDFEHIYIHGHVERDVIFNIASSAKVILMLSRVEPFGMATIEAMSMGCIPVAWDIETGTKEIVSANKTALFAPLGDIKILANQVFRACNEYEAFANNVIEQARSNFDATVMWKHYESLIKEVSSLPTISRSKEGQKPTNYKPPIRRFQLLPSPVRSAIRDFVGRSPQLGYLLRDFRGL